MRRLPRTRIAIHATRPGAPGGTFRILLGLQTVQAFPLGSFIPGASPAARRLAIGAAAIAARWTRAALTDPRGRRTIKVQSGSEESTGCESLGGCQVRLGSSCGAQASCLHHKRVLHLSPATTLSDRVILSPHRSQHWESCEWKDQVPLSHERVKSVQVPTSHERVKSVHCQPRADQSSASALQCTRCRGVLLCLTVHTHNKHIHTQVPTTHQTVPHCACSQVDKYIM